MQSVLFLFKEDNNEKKPVIVDLSKIGETLNAAIITETVRILKDEYPEYKKKLASSLATNSSLNPNASPFIPGLAPTT